MSARPRPRQAQVALSLLAVVAAVGAGGCGKGRLSGAGLPGAATTVGAGQSQAAAQLGFPTFATKNTTRVGGVDPVADAAAVAQAVYPGLTPQTRPQAVVLADERDWISALAAAQLMSAPLRAPLLYSDGTRLPPASADALRALAPTGSPALGGAQVIRVGNVATPAGYRVRSLAAANPYALAAAVAALAAGAAATPIHSALVVSSQAAAYAMPAAGYAAEAGVPILFVTATAVPLQTRAALAQLGRGARIYVLGPGSVISGAVVTSLRRLGTVHRIRGADPVANAIAFARYDNAGFGWNVVQPGHGLVFLATSRPLDAAAAAPLSASGDYGPPLLLDQPAHIPPLLQNYLLDIQPGYEPGVPGHGAVDESYNRGWVIGDQSAISTTAQAEIDGLLEIAPVSSGASQSVSPVSP